MIVSKILLNLSFRPISPKISSIGLKNHLQWRGYLRKGFKIPSVGLKITSDGVCVGEEYKG